MMEELRKEIKRIFWEFDNAILPRVLGNFLTRLDYVIENEGSYVEHLLHGTLVCVCVCINIADS